MSKKGWINQRFYGGQATDKKVGQSESFSNSQSLDFRKSPSQMSVLPGTRRADGGTVTDLVQNEVMTQSGRTYSIGSSGHVYTCSPSGVWSLFGSVSKGTFGIEYRQDQDTIFIATDNAVSSITSVSTNPSLNPDFYSISKSTYNNNSNTAPLNVNSDVIDGSESTDIKTSYNESLPNDLRYWQTDITPVVRISVFVNSKGAGDWAMVIHDGLNKELGTATILNANIVENSWNNFNFPQIDVNVGPNNAQTYHFHLTSTVTGGSIRSVVNNDLSTACMQLYADRLITTKNGMHPMTTFQQFLVIGNGRYLSVYEPLGEPEPSNSSWQRQKLIFPPGYEVCGISVFNEYLAIATERTTTGDNTPQEGIIFYWDGLSTTYNYFTKIPEGSPQSINEYENTLWYVAGGSWYAITSVAATPAKVRRLPGSENVYTASNASTKTYPYTSAVRYGIHLLGWPSVTSNLGIPYGIYSYGKTDSTLPNAFGYSYILSTGTQYKNASNNLTIGMVRNFGNVLHVSWRDDSTGVSTYGVDIVDGSSRPSPYATWESLIFDGGYVTKQKLASYIDASWLEMQDGIDIVLKYSINRGDWISSPKYNNQNLYLDKPGWAKFFVSKSPQGERFREIQIGVDIYCSSSVTEPPTIVSVDLVYDDNREEQLQ